MELQAYYHLGIEHYYLKNMEKSKYYSTRFARGMLEADDSMTKRMYYQEAKISYKHYYIPNNLDINRLKEKPDIRSLPSPSDGRHT